MRADDVRVVERLVRSSFASLEDDVSSKLAVMSGDLEWTRLLLTEDEDGHIDQLALIEKVTSYNEMMELSYVELISSDSTLISRSGDYSSFDARITRPVYDAPDSTGIRSGMTTLNVAGDRLVYVLASAPIFYKGDLIAYLQGGRTVDRIFLAELENLTGATLEFDSSDSDALRIGFPTIDGAGELSLTASLPESKVERLLGKILWLYALIAVSGILLAGVIGYFSSRQLTVPIGELVHAAEEISRGKFERRIVWFGRDELGTLVDGFNTMYDRLKRSQEKLVQSEKIAAWNQMARKVAHEIRNPLTPIQVSVEDLKRSYDSNKPEFSQILNDAVETVGSEISRLKRLTDEFSQFARLPTPVMTKKDIRPIVADALRIYGEEIRVGRLTVRLPKSDIQVEIDADLFSQALLNLVKNGLEASGTDGKVVVTGELGKGIARVVVEDNGPGVPDDQVARLFTPYFTTKKGGTGLGLVIAYRIVFDHGGRIRYEKGESGGARFVVVLPLAERIS
jgi:signal transduction histidine kinase